MAWKKRNKMKWQTIASWNGLWNISSKLEWLNLRSWAEKTWGAVGGKFFMSEDSEQRPQTVPGPISWPLEKVLHTQYGPCCSSVLARRECCPRVWVGRAVSGQSSASRSPGLCCQSAWEVTAKCNHRRKIFPLLSLNMKLDQQWELMTSSPTQLWLDAKNS